MAVLVVVVMISVVVAACGCFSDCGSCGYCSGVLMKVVVRVFVVVVLFVRIKMVVDEALCRY